MESFVGLTKFIGGVVGAVFGANAGLAGLIVGGFLGAVLGALTGLFLVAVFTLFATIVDSTKGGAQ